jgi:hypothetical protein
MWHVAHCVWLFKHKMLKIGAVRQHEPGLVLFVCVSSWGFDHRVCAWPRGFASAWEAWVFGMGVCLCATPCVSAWGCSVLRLEQQQQRLESACVVLSTSGAGSTSGNKAAAAAADLVLLPFWRAQPCTGTLCAHLLCAGLRQEWRLESQRGWPNESVGFGACKWQVMMVVWPVLVCM